MPILYMDSKTFLKGFIKQESDKNILDATYIVASNTIRIGKRYKDQCEVMFLPDNYTIMKLNDEEDIVNDSNSEYVQSYYDSLKKQRGQIAKIIKITEENNLLVVILTTSKENRALNHLKLLSIWIKDNFDYKIIPYNPEHGIPRLKKDYVVIERCNKAIRKMKRKRKRRLMKTEKGQLEYFSSLGKKELKKLLKKEGLYLPGMNEPEMIETAITFLV